jgi:hypothetical protein
MAMLRQVRMGNQKGNIPGRLFELSAVGSERGSPQQLLSIGSAVLEGVERPWFLAGLEMSAADRCQVLACQTVGSP